MELTVPSPRPSPGGNSGRQTVRCGCRAVRPFAFCTLECLFIFEIALVSHYLLNVLMRQTLGVNLSSKWPHVENDAILAREWPEGRGRFASGKTFISASWLA